MVKTEALRININKEFLISNKQKLNYRKTNKSNLNGSVYHSAIQKIFKNQLKLFC